MTLRVALLGAGAMGTIMARDVYPLLRERVEVVAVVDVEEDRRDALATALGARGYASLAAAAAAEEPDAVDVRLPHAAHADAAVAALDLGLHVLVEKPLALTLADCRRVADAAARAGRVTAVAENYPHVRAVRATRAAIDAGEVGEVLAVRTTRAYTLDGVWAQSAWRRGPGPAAGLLWDQGTHHTSMLRVLGGEIAGVAARRTVRDDGAETVTLDLRFASGLLGQSLYCWGTPGADVEVEGLVLGSRGRIEVGVAYDAPRGAATLHAGGACRQLSEPESYYDSHRWIVEDWADAIRTGRPPRVGLASAAADVRVVLAARESVARDGGEVTMEEVGG